MTETAQQQIELAQQLQTLLLEDFLKLAQKGDLSPTDRRTLYQMLKDGGWCLDPSRLPSDLSSKLLTAVTAPGSFVSDWDSEEDELPI